MHSYTKLTLNFFVKTIFLDLCSEMLIFNAQSELTYSVIAYFLLNYPASEYRQIIFVFNTPFTALLSSPTCLDCPTLPLSPFGVSCFCSSLFPEYVSTFPLLSLVLAPWMASSPATVNHSTPPESWRESSSLSDSLCNADGTRHCGVAPPRGLQ